VMRYILHYTDPGDIVFDGFCGTGMTGVAAQLCGDKKTVESLGFRVTGSRECIPVNQANPEPGTRNPKLGPRKAVLVDLSPAATFIAYNYNAPVNVAAFERETRRILREVEDECGWMYETLHTDGETKGRIIYPIWSDVFSCPECGGEMVFWNVAVDREAGKVRDSICCPHCGIEQQKRDLDRTWDTVYDPALGQTVRSAKQVPVIINYSVGKGRHNKQSGDEDLTLVHKILEGDIPYLFPTNTIPEGDKTSDPLSIGVTHLHHFYTRRNLWCLAALWHQNGAMAQAVRPAAAFSLTAAMRYLSRMSKLGTTYYFRGGGGAINAGVLGTFYIPSFSAENNVFRTMSVRLPKLYRVLRQLSVLEPVCISAQSASGLGNGPDGFADYIFVDPPFGGNLMYSELNFLWETWLRVATNNRSEAVVNRTQRKGLLDYQGLMEQCFCEFYRILKPGRWMTVEFHNSKNNVWNAIQEAMLRAGFVVADVRTFDKRQGTFNQVTASGAVKQDLIISAYKPRTGFERRFLEQAGTEEGVWTFVRQHLDKLPIVVEQDGTLEVVAERQAYLLYDRMVDFHIQLFFFFDMGSSEFYSGLKQRFPERDGMYFLPQQTAEYDRRRMQVSKVEQLALFVTDEKSAIQWLRRELDPATGSGPQTYQDLQPRFLRELHQARHEALPELSDVLAQNFLKDEADRWYVPDPGHQEDLEKLRERSLLREFQEYAQGKGRLRVFRTEAVRAGFKHAWRERDYRLIVKVAERLPPSVLQEDAGLLMYYDNALMRAEEEPEQGRLL